MLIIGHRGAMGYAPENTLRSFQTAIADGVDAIEMDVHLLKTGELVVVHDSTLNRTTNGHGFVSEHTLESLKKLDAGMGEKIPTLSEALDMINRRVMVIIEMSGIISCAEELVRVIKQYVEEKKWSYKDFKVISFNQHELKRFHELLPQVEIGVNISTIPITYAKFTEDCPVDFIASEDIYLPDDNFVKDAHQRGMKFFVYSVNHPDYLQRFVNFGVDGIYTNNPRLFKKQKIKS